MDLFRPAAPAAPVATPVNPAQASANQNPLVPNQGNSPVIPGADTAIPSPLEGYSDLWQAPDPSKTTPDTPLFQMDPKKLQAAVSKINFTDTLTPDILAAVAGGGDAAVAALKQYGDTLGRGIFAQSTATTAKLIEQALKRNTTDIESRIPNLIKSQNVSSLNRAENPLFSNPATAPIMSALESQFQTKYPNATAAEITAHTKAYLTEFVTLAGAPDRAAAEAAKTKDDTDFSTW